MKAQQRNSLGRTIGVCRAPLIACAAAAVFFLVAMPPAEAAITWDADAGTHWWFDKVNWRTDPITNLNDAIPPIGVTGGATDTEISIGTGAWDQGFGVVYHPDSAHDPNFANAGSFTFPSGFGPQRIQQLYMSRSANPPTGTPVPDNKLTLRGDLEAAGNVILGRSSGVTGVATNALIVQESGTFKAEQNMDLGANEQGTSGRLGYGNGTYDYRGGSLEVSQVGGSGLRLSNGGSGGPGGVGRFIMHKPSTDGHVRAFDVVVAGSQGGSSTFLPDGVDTGVGIFEFHFENGGVRPIQVNRNMSINTGKVSATSDAIRSARLDLVLQEAPCVGTGCVPQDLGLFDVGFSQAGALLGTGDLRGDETFNNDRVFSSADGTKPFYPSSEWAAVQASPNFSGLQDEDFLVTAVFGDTLYRWEASYSGDITWVGNGDTGQVASLSGTGGIDVVLLGHSSVSIGLAGDFNNDNSVDAADYVLWRKTGGDSGPHDYNTWRTNFGRTSGGGAGAGLSLGTVPEPVAIVLALVGLMGLTLVRRRQ